MTSNELFNYFNAYITSQKIEYNINSLKFHVRLKHLNIKGIDTSKSRTCNYKTIDINEVKQYFNIVDNIDFTDEENEGDNEVIV
jgi:hypothetical protein